MLKRWGFDQLLRRNASEPLDGFRNRAPRIYQCMKFFSGAPILESDSPDLYNLIRFRRQASSLQIQGDKVI